jgi:hypothetical protein
LLRTLVSRSIRAKSAYVSVLGLCLNRPDLVASNLIRKLGATILIGWTNLWIDGRTVVTPELNRRRALIVLGKIEEILAWEQTKEPEAMSGSSNLGNISVRCAPTVLAARESEVVRRIPR